MVWRQEVVLRLCVERQMSVVFLVGFESFLAEVSGICVTSRAGCFSVSVFQRLLAAFFVWWSHCGIVFRLGVAWFAAMLLLLL
mmetsp:Transcript_91577/g.245328  ORF Transcript_91577/g.245328 Transcript_91577/m.245328 type:complete len:83 (+) Transcript_91577:89-337(+)